jgi:hypothetical protein
MTFWKHNQKLLLQRWDLHRRQIEREVAERRRDLVRRNMRQSAEWNSYEPFTDWYLEREVEAFVSALDEVSGAGHHDIDDDSLDEMDRMLGEMIDRRLQLAPAEALQMYGQQNTRVKGSARVSLLRVQSARRAERDRGLTTPSPPPIRRPQSSAETAAPEAAPAAPSPPEPEPAAVPAEAAAPAGAPHTADPRSLAQSLRQLAVLVQQLPDPEAQVETMEELQFVAEEATVEPDRRKLRMVGAALARIRSRIAEADADSGATAAGHIEPIRLWFESG